MLGDKPTLDLEMEEDDLPELLGALRDAQSSLASGVMSVHEAQKRIGQVKMLQVVMTAIEENAPKHAFEAGVGYVCTSRCNCDPYGGRVE